ncbi:MAG: hypothetical protein LUE96_09805 [Lachnospiraceae bacterium]|nr:hypothetical protein [Lachnospiraceae bacterium]
MEKFLTPLNHREIEYHARRLSGCDIPDSLGYKSDEAAALFEWLDRTGGRVFDDALVMDYGTDCLRLYLLFEKTPEENDAPFYESWNEGELEGMYKFLCRYRRMILAVLFEGGCADVTKESITRMQDALDGTEKKIDRCIRRGNDRANRHGVVSALMELLKLLQKELRVGELVTGIRIHAQNERNFANTCPYREDVERICRNFISLMAPIAPDISKILFMEMQGVLY